MEKEEKLEIDFISLEKKLKRDEWFNNIKNQKISDLLIEAGLISGTTAMFANELIIAGIIWATLSFFKGYKLQYLDYDNAKNMSKKFDSAIRQTDTYKKCRGEYQSYLNKLAEFIKNDLGISDGIVVAEIYQYMLDSGLLSYPKSHKYYNKYNLYDYYELEELKGCRIATGSSVCRNMSSFIVDLEKELNNDAYYAHCFSIKESDNPVLNLDEYLLSHAVALIKDHNEILYAFDPTNDTCSNNLTTIHDKNNLNYLTYNANNFDFYIPENAIFTTSNIRKGDISISNLDIINMPPIILQLRYIQNEYKGYTIYKEAKEECNEFYLKTKKQLGIIKESYEDIVPLTEQKIKKHIIR